MKKKTDQKKFWVEVVNVYLISAMPVFELLSYPYKWHYQSQPSKQQEKEKNRTQNTSYDITPNSMRTIQSLRPSPNDSGNGAVCHLLR